MSEYSWEESSNLESRQTRDASGDPIWKVGDITRLKRFLNFGVENGCATAGEGSTVFSESSVPVLQKLLEDGHGKKVIEAIHDFGVNSRTNNQCYILFALAYCCRLADDSVRAAAYGILNDVCRTPTHLFKFVVYCEQLSQGTGWGRAHRRAICNWYTQFSETPGKLAMLVTKYKNREGWCHLDILRLSHLKPANDAIDLIVKYVVKGLNEVNSKFGGNTDEKVHKTLSYLNAVEEAMKCSDTIRLADLITSHNLVREHIPTPMLNKQDVWKALLMEMPMLAMVKNLGKMTSINLLVEGSDELELVIMRLKDQELLKKSHMHPLTLLSAWNVYKKGSGEKGKLTWNPCQSLCTALEDAMYMSVSCVEPTGKRYCVAINVSSSMDSPVTGLTNVSCREAAAAMLITMKRTEPNCDVVAFSNRLIEQIVETDARLDDVCRQLSRVPQGNVSITLPITQAQKRCRDYDVFVTFSDSVSCTNDLRSTLRRYRHVRKNKEARYIAVGLSSCYSRSDNDDPGMLDVAGFDANFPNLMKRFVSGEI